ncbi:MAG: Gfo/Idh/MocA family oxidoreductase [Oligosphaeraceae bacterium]
MEREEETRREQLRRLAPFVQRAGIAETGRQRLLQHRNKLAFVLVTRDLSPNSLKETLREFPCPVYQAFSPEDVEAFLGFKGTKLVGFRRGSLSSSVQKILRGCLVPLENLREAVLPSPLRVVVFGAGAAGLRHSRLWRDAGAEVVGYLEGDSRSMAVAGKRMQEVFHGREIPGDTDPERLMERVCPSVVDVCLPTEYHYPACAFALRLGCHVLCETPFLDEAGEKPRTLRRQTQTLLSMAARHQRLLGIARRDEDVTAFARGKATPPVLDAPRPGEPAEEATAMEESGEDGSPDFFS